VTGYNGLKLLSNKASFIIKITQKHNTSDKLKRLQTWIWSSPYLIAPHQPLTQEGPTNELGRAFQIVLRVILIIGMLIFFFSSST
jgi:hypothetical protein